jgi:hypothetical protein
MFPRLERLFPNWSWHESRVASQDNLSSHLVFNESLETLRDIQDEFLLREARWSDAAGVVTSVTCVDNHA